MLSILQGVDGDDEITTLLQEAAERATVDDPHKVASLLEVLQEWEWLGPGQDIVLADRAAGDAPVQDPAAVADLLEALEQACILSQLTMLADRAVSDAPLQDPAGVGDLLIALKDTGATEQVSRLLARNPRRPRGA